MTGTVPTAPHRHREIVDGRCCIVLLLALGLAGCGAENEPLAYPPEPVPPGLRERAEAGDAAAQLDLAEHLWPAHSGDPEPLYWLVAAACQGHPVAQVSLGALYDARAAAQGEPEGRHLADELRATLTEAERAWALEPPDLADAPDCVQWRK
jgi:predicted small lipoprotein YifL